MNLLVIYFIDLFSLLT